MKKLLEKRLRSAKPNIKVDTAFTARVMRNIDTKTGLKTNPWAPLFSVKRLAPTLAVAALLIGLAIVLPDSERVDSPQMADNVEVVDDVIVEESEQVTIAENQEIKILEQDVGAVVELTGSLEADLTALINEDDNDFADSILDDGSLFN